MEPTELRIFKNIDRFADFPDFQTGGVGFGLWNYTARFDNITVTGDSVPNSGNFAVTPQGKTCYNMGTIETVLDIPMIDYLLRWHPTDIKYFNFKSR